MDSADFALNALEAEERLVFQDFLLCFLAVQILDCGLQKLGERPEECRQCCSSFAFLTGLLELCHISLSLATHSQVVAQVCLPDLPICQLWLLGQAGQEQVEELLVHVVAHLVQDEPTNDC